MPRQILQVVSSTFPYTHLHFALVKLTLTLSSRAAVPAGADPVYNTYGMCSSPLSVAWLVEKGFYIIFLAGFLLLSFVLYTRGVNFNALFLCLPLYRRGSCTE